MYILCMFKLCYPHNSLTLEHRELNKATETVQFQLPGMSRADYLMDLNKTDHVMMGCVESVLFTSRP